VQKLMQAAHFIVAERRKAKAPASPTSLQGLANKWGASLKQT
jgi:hypothetical protein